MSSSITNETELNELVELKTWAAEQCAAETATETRSSSKVLRPATKAALTRAAATCLLARLLKALLTAQESSDAAKATAANDCRFEDYAERDGSDYARANYRRSRAAREARYADKERALAEAVRLAAALGITYGWRDGVLYFDLPAQVSFHAARHGAPDYAWPWDGIVGASRVRIAEEVERYVAAPVEFSAAAFDAAAAAAERAEHAVREAASRLERSEWVRGLIRARLAGQVYRLADNRGGLLLLWQSWRLWSSHNPHISRPLVEAPVQQRKPARTAEEWRLLQRKRELERRRLRREAALKALGASFAAWSQVWTIGAVAVATADGLGRERRGVYRAPNDPYYYVRHETHRVRGLGKLLALARELRRDAPRLIAEQKARHAAAVRARKVDDATRARLGTVALCRAEAARLKLPGRSKLNSGELYRALHPLVLAEVEVELAKATATA